MKNIKKVRNNKPEKTHKFNLKKLKSQLQQVRIHRFTKGNLLFFMAVICFLYGIFLFIVDFDFAKGGVPVLELPEKVLTLSIEDSEKSLLKGAKAYDKEDGDLTDKIFVKEMSPFDKNQERTVTYAVFDKDDQIAEGTRKIKYRDYKPPVFNIKKPLVYPYINSKEELKAFVSAKSYVDGDISPKISVDKTYTKGNRSYAEFSVEDSCGGSSSIRLKLDKLMFKPSINIKLKEYLIRVEEGTEIDPMEYLTKIEFMGMSYDSLYSKVEVQSDYNPYKPGTYEFIYRIDLTATDFGVSKLVVIVE